MFRILFRIVILMLIGLGLLASLLTYQFFYRPILKNPPATSIIIKPGSSLRMVAYQLHDEKLLAHPRIFIAWAQWKDYAHLLKAGEYEIDTQMTAPQLLQNMVSGKMLLHKITFVEGWTFVDVRAALDQNPFVAHTIASLSDQDIMKKLGSAIKSPEGLFFPETYAFTRGDEDLQILKTAYKKMNEVLNFQWSERAAHLPYHNSYQALIIASMVEKETAFPGDRSQVAGVIERRLQKGMRLQIDAAVIYGLKKPAAHPLTKSDLKQDTLYNTYLHAALPPTPICMPSEGSIYAALHPDSSQNLYYVARGDGSSQFSVSYEKHKKAVAQYINSVKKNLLGTPLKGSAISTAMPTSQEAKTP